MSTTRGLGFRLDRAAESAGPGLPTSAARARCRRSLAWLLLVGSAGALSGAALGATPRDLEERISCQRRIEQVYWSHRIWPSENPGPKPDLTAVLTRRQLVARVERSRLEEAALERVWGERLGPERIQAELDRIGRSSRRPELLRELFAGLEHDPDLVAECLVRPRLAARALRERYAWDREIHREVRRRAESELAAAASWRDLEWGSARMAETLWVRRDAGAPLDAPEERPVDGEVRLGPEEWDERLRGIAARFAGERPGRWPEPAPSSALERLERRVGRGPSPLYEEADRFTAVAVLAVEERAVKVVWAIWPKEPFDAWFERVRDELRTAPPEPGSYRLPTIAAGAPCADDTWSAAPGLPDFVPATRRRHTAVWTGTEMIVWGGFDGSSRLDTGGRYDPATDIWVATSRAGAPS
ncbi:MAG TPA: kelch repeat-containing protein, partial [Thermoanaerobaculia bacterium]|nr:kelch repeat-containing protein [Thermoanaerobaculia bacterium]